MGLRNYDIIRSVDELTTLIDKIAGNVFALDIETGFEGPDREKGSVHPETAFIVGISFTDSTDWARYVPLGHDEGENLDNVEVARLFWPLLNTGLGVAHNFSFELRHLSKWFRLHLWDDPEFGEAVRESNGYFPVYSDSMVEAYLAADFQRFGLKLLTMLMFDRQGNPVSSDLYLNRSRVVAEINKIKDETERKKQLLEFDGHVMTELHELFPDLQKNRRKFLRCNTLPLTPQVIDYACEDSVWCLAIHRRYHAQVSQGDTALLYRVEMAIVQDVVPDMEDEGILYAWQQMSRTADELRVFRDRFNAEIMTELTELTGEPAAINLASAPAISKVLYDKLGYSTNVYTDKTRDLPPGERRMSTGKIALERLAKQYPVVHKIREWKQMTRLLGTYLDRYERLYNYADDGRVHPNHLSAFVITGRFAVSDPPYQQCLPGSYEALTPYGWVRLDEIPDDIPVAQYHQAGGIDFVVPEQVVRAPYTGDMIELRGGEIGTWRYTPNHRLIYKTRVRRSHESGARHTAIEETDAASWEASLLKMAQGRRRLDRLHITSGIRQGGRVLTGQELRTLKLAVAVQADGTRTNGHQYDIAVHKDRKVDRLRDLGLAPEQQSRGRWRVRVPRFWLSRWLDENKNFRPDAILVLSALDLETFLGEVMFWDGDFTRSRTYGQNVARRTSVDVVQAAAALTGLTTSLYERPNYNAVTVNITASETKGSGWQEPVRIPNVDGMVYCVTVPTGMWLCRNDQGKVMVTGNSPKKYHYDLAEARAAHAAGEEPPAGTCFRFNFRDMIVAPPDHYILGFDLSQAELRAIAGLSQEAALLEAFAKGEDVHRLTASLMLGVPLDEVDGKQRDIGKTLNFAIVFGLSVQGLADRLAISVDEAQALMNKYFAGLPSVAAWMSRMVEQGKTNLYVTSKFGRKMPIWEYCSDNRKIRAKGDRACVNYPAQGGATGDYMKIAMVRAKAALKKAGLTDRVKLVMNIHDALEFYVHRSVQPQDVIKVLQPAVIFPVRGWPDMSADWHIALKWGSPLEVTVNPDGSLTVKGDKVYDLAPTLEEDEDGELVEVLPDVDIDMLRQVARSADTSATASA